MEITAINVFWAFVITAATYTAFDLLWLGWVAKDFYRRQLKNKLRPKANVHAATLFYSLYSASIVYFAVLPALRDESLVVAASSGFLLGLVVYGAYNLVNYSLVKGWPKRLAAVDICWGSFATFTAAVVAYNLLTGLFG